MYNLANDIPQTEVMPVITLLPIYTDSTVNNGFVANRSVANTNPFGQVMSVGTSIAIPSNINLLTERLKQRWPYILSKASQLQLSYPDAVQSLINLFSNIPIDYDTWREIVEEPYG